MKPQTAAQVEAAKLLAAYTQGDDLSDLAKYINRCVQQGYSTRANITRRMEFALNTLHGEYLPELLPEDDPDCHTRLCSKKARQAENWLRSVLMAASGKLWTLRPTARPEIPQEMQEMVMARLQQEAQQNNIDPATLASLRDALSDLAEKHIAGVAADSNAAMTERIKDILDEGAFASELVKFIITLSRNPFAVMEAPLIGVSPQIRFDPKAPNGAGVVNVGKVSVRNIDPLTVYWSGDSTSLNNGRFMFIDDVVTADYLLEAVQVGLPAFIKEAVDAVVAKYTSFDSSLLPSDEHLKRLRKGETTGELLQEGSLRCIRFFGKVPNKYLIDVLQGAEHLDVRRMSECEVWLVNNTVVRCQLNTLPKSVRPFFAASFYSADNAVVGEGICDVLRDCERAANSAMRNMMRNLPFAAAPLIEVARERMLDPKDAAGLEIKAGNTYDVTTSGFGGDQPLFAFHAVPVNVEAMEAVLTRFEARADEISGIPQHVSGSVDVASMARTASGLAMLMRAATQTLQNAVANIDTFIIEPIITVLHDMIMLYDPDTRTKGDSSVVAQGVAGVLNREYGQAQLREMLTTVAPYAQAGLVPPTLLVALIRAILTEAGYDADALVPSDTSSRALEWQNLLNKAASGVNGNVMPNAARTPDMTGGSNLPTNDGRFVK